MQYLRNKKTGEHRLYEDALDWFDMDCELIQSDADGWIEWSGGECPLPKHAKCEHIMRCAPNNDTFDTELAGHLRWTHENLSGDIIAYRPILEPQAEQVKDDSLGSPQYHPAYQNRYSTGKIDTSDQVKEWRGPEDGLPPVGCECIYMGNEDRKGKITHHMKSGFAAVLEYENDGYDTGGVHDFKPIRTDRERWIEAADRIGSKMPAGDINLLYAALYDAGLAKLPEQTK